MTSQGAENAPLRGLWGEDRALQNEAFERVMAATDEPVPWAEEVWDEVVRNLTDADNRRRSIAAQVLCNLAKSDPGGRIARDLPALLEVTRDPRFVTARHALQSTWKVGVVSAPLRARLVDALRTRFEESASEKNGTLVRYDIAVVLRKMYDAVADEELRDTALALIANEDDPQYRKKYVRVWNGTD